MRIQKLQEEFPWTTEQTKSRSPGLHLSDVIHDMDRELMKTAERKVDEATMLQFEKGYLWEVALSRAFGEKAAVRIGEIELDGVIGSPDGYTRGSNQEKVVEEYKCTALSAESTPANNWKWLMQVKGYCKMLGVRKCVFRVLHHVAIMHDPANAYAPWELVFTQGELDENWEAVLNHVKTMKRRG